MYTPDLGVTNIARIRPLFFPGLVPRTSGMPRAPLVSPLQRTFGVSAPKTFPVSRTAVLIRKVSVPKPVLKVAPTLLPSAPIAMPVVSRPLLATGGAPTSGGTVPLPDFSDVEPGADKPKMNVLLLAAAAVAGLLLFTKKGR